HQDLLPYEPRGALGRHQPTGSVGSEHSPNPASLGMSSGLWRSPVAHLVRIEGVRGSNPLSSTMAHKALFPPGTGPCVRADRHAGSAVRVNPLWRVLTLFSGPEPRVSPAKRPSPESGAAGHIFTLGHAHRACPDQHDGTPR